MDSYRSLLMQHAHASCTCTCIYTYICVHVCILKFFIGKNGDIDIYDLLLKVLLVPTIRYPHIGSHTVQESHIGSHIVQCYAEVETK